MSTATLNGIPSSADRNSMLERLGRFAARHHWWFIAAWLLIAFTVGAWGNRLGADTTDNFTIPGTESQTAADLLKQDFPALSGTTGTLVFQASSGAVTDPANAAAVNQAVQNLSAVQGIEPIVPAGVNVTPIEFAQAAGRVSTTDPSIAYFGLQFSDPAPELARSVTEHPNLWDQMETAVQPAEQAGVRPVIGGEIADIFNPPESTLSDHADDIGLALAVVILLIALGAFVSMLVPVGVALFGVGTAMSLTILLEHHFQIGTVAPILGTMLGLGVGIDYSLFILSRYRQGLLDGHEPEHAVGRAMATSGSAVLFAGITVCLAMGALALMGVPYVRTLGLIAALFVIVVVLAALTFLPAVLGALGRRVNKGRMPWHHRTAENADASRTLSARWAHEIARFPWLFAPLSLIVLLLLAAPLLRINTGFPDDGSAPTDTPQRQAYDLVANGFGPGANGPLLIAVDLPSSLTGDQQTLTQSLQSAQQKLEQVSGVQKVQAVTNTPANTVAVLLVTPTTGPDDGATTDLVEHLRNTAIPQAVEGTQIDASQVYVGGQTAVLIDLTKRINERMLPIIATVLLGSFVLLMMVFRSLFVPFKAAIMNLLSIGASYGVLVAVFNWGWGKDLIGLQETVTIASFVPIMMFAILFGLSMDYEVFLLSRIREEYLKSGDSHGSVVVGLSNTARVITAAASIMIAVFLSYVTNPSPTVKMLGLGLATAVFIDATIVRMVLVPATMELAGRANWWLPKWLDRILPNLHVDEPEPESTDDDDEPDAPDRSLVGAGV
jgi:RND superfamily putative drug exporter